MKSEALLRVIGRHGNALNVDWKSTAVRVVGEREQLLAVLKWLRNECPAEGKDMTDLDWAMLGIIDEMIQGIFE